MAAQTSGRWMNRLARGSAGHEVWAGLRTIPRHRHPKAYAAVIFSGSYEESGSYGRYPWGSLCLLAGEIPERGSSDHRTQRG